MWEVPLGNAFAQCSSWFFSKFLAHGEELT